MLTILSAIKDKRYILAWVVQFSSISAYGLLGSLAYTFQRPGIWMYAVCILFSLVLEIVTAKFLKKPVSAVSALITGAACFVQLSSPNWIAFLMVLFFAHSCKLIFRIENRHIYNPANIGILILLTTLPSWGTQDAMQWYIANPYTISQLIFISGSITVVLADRWILSGAYLVFFFFGAYARQMATGVDYTFFWMPIFGAGMLIYLFHMISDPVTTPKSVKGQIIFGALVASLDHFLRHQGVFYSVLISLAVVSALRGILLSLRLVPAFTK